ncbi:DUF6713 family protein [Halobacteriaceae archaeon GCM10025711]
MADTHRWSTTLYLLNAALLFTHEIDSAFWEEWTLFGLPGGIQLFLVLNFVLLLAFLYGYGLLVAGRRTGDWFALLLAGAGLFAVVAHGFFLATGHPEFRLPVSLALLAATAVVSPVQAWLAVAALRSPSHD